MRTSILGNVGTLIAFRVGAGDAAKLMKEFGSNVETEDLTFLPNRSFWVRLLVDGAAVPAFTGETLWLGQESL